MSRDAVGAPVIIVARVAVALAASPSHSKHSPLCISAIRVVPKLSNDHKPGSVTLSVLAAGDPHPVQLEVLVTVAPPLCAARVEPLTALVIPVKLVAVTPV